MSDENGFHSGKWYLGFVWKEYKYLYISLRFTKPGYDYAWVDGPHNSLSFGFIDITWTFK